MAEPRFLILRLGSLGDIVHTFPAVAGLRETFPNAEIVWFTHPRWEFLVQSSRLASRVVVVETRSFSSLRKTIQQIRETAWTAALDYQGLWKSALLPFLGGVQRRIGFSSTTIREFAVPVLYSDRVLCSTTHIADQNGELSVRAGASRGVAEFSLGVPSEAESTIREMLRKEQINRYVVLGPGGGWLSKCWPPERFGALCEKIKNSFGMRCVVNSGPGERKLAAAVRSSGGDANPLVFEGELGPLMALLRNAACFVGGDTGPLHLAIAMGTPTVALYGPTDPARNGPYRQVTPRAADHALDIVLRVPGAGTTHRRGDAPHPSMLAIEVDAVFDAVCRQIEVSA